MNIIKQFLVKEKLIDNSEWVRFLKMPSKSNKNAFIPVLIFIGSSKEPNLIAMIFRNPKNADLFEHIVRKRSQIKKKLDGSSIGDALPKNFIYDSDAMFLIESYIRGQSLVPVFLKSVISPSRASKAAIHRINEWLLKFHSYTYNGNINASDFSFYFREHEIDILEEALGSSFKVILNYLIKCYNYNFKIPVTYCHGDFNVYNIKINSGNVKVYDWEDLSEKEIPLLDFFHLFTVPVISKRLNSRNYKENFEKYICSYSPYKAFFCNSLINYCKQFNITNEYANWYYLVYLLKMCLKEKNVFRYDESRVSVWSDIAVKYVEIADGKLLI